mmetsp:Transcript_34273/g.77452  ORF Transcript_34273/g.77452 Transcript_34273/m.77452 type:complete len:104 (+) Transcript_34273:1124-1435(+)
MKSPSLAKASPLSSSPPLYNPTVALPSSETVNPRLETVSSFASLVAPLLPASTASESSREAGLLAGLLGGAGPRGGYGGAAEEAAEEPTSSLGGEVRALSATL